MSRVWRLVGGEEEEGGNVRGGRGWGMERRLGRGSGRRVGARRGRSAWGRCCGLSSCLGG